jgi:hypothetical protein
LLPRILDKQYQLAFPKVPPEADNILTIITFCFFCPFFLANKKKEKRVNKTNRLSSVHHRKVFKGKK